MTKRIRLRVERLSDFLREDVRAALPGEPTFRTGAVAERLKGDYDLSDPARRLLGRFINGNGGELGVRWVAGPSGSRRKVSSDKGSLWERTR